MPVGILELDKRWGLLVKDHAPLSGNNEIKTNETLLRSLGELARSPENYRELQAMVHHCDSVFIGRNGAWIGSQAVLLAIAIAQFERVPASMLLTLVATGVMISVFWLVVAKSLGDRIRWLDDEICKYEGSIHERYLSDRRSRISRRTSFRIMVYALPATFAGAWILLAIVKIKS